MKYFHRNKLIIEYPTTFLCNDVIARIIWKVAFTSLIGEKIRFIRKGSHLRENKSASPSGYISKQNLGQRSKQNIVLVDIYLKKEDFVDAISRYFSELLKVNPQNIKFRFETPSPFGGELNS